ncbi:MAG TPA: zeta toxin family protein [Patescibacteria group bacterium]|nr:zeta toxin family protein [Patescibacteria group bacterium]
MAPLIDPAIVAQELDKPIQVDREIRAMYGVPARPEAPVYYSAEQRAEIEREKDRIYAEMVAGKKQSGEFVLTVGGPGSGKTSLVRALQKLGGPLAGYVHTDPDEEVLTRFKPYLADATTPVESDITRAVAYTYWRWASLYVNNSVLNRAVDEGFNIAMGTTATSPMIAKTYDALHDMGREVKAIIVHAPEAVRLESVAPRFKVDRRYVPEEDVKAKGNVMLPDIIDLHFAKADSIDLYWRDRTDSGPVLAATLQQGRVVVHDQTALKPS